VIREWHITINGRRGAALAFSSSERECGRGDGGRLRESRSRVLRHSLSFLHAVSLKLALRSPPLLRKQQQPATSKHAAGTATARQQFQLLSRGGPADSPLSTARAGCVRVSQGQHSNMATRRLGLEVWRTFGAAATVPPPLAKVSRPFAPCGHRRPRARRGLPARRRRSLAGGEARTECHRAGHLDPVGPLALGTMLCRTATHAPCSAPRSLARSDRSFVIRLFRTIIAADRFFCTFPLSAQIWYFICVTRPLVNRVCRISLVLYSLAKAFPKIQLRTTG